MCVRCEWVLSYCILIVCRMHPSTTHAFTPIETKMEINRLDSYSINFTQHTKFTPNHQLFIGCRAAQLCNSITFSCDLFVFFCVFVDAYENQNEKQKNNEMDCFFWAVFHVTLSMLSICECAFKNSTDMAETRNETSSSLPGWTSSVYVPFATWITTTWAWMFFLSPSFSLARSFSCTLSRSRSLLLFL